MTSYDKIAMLGDEIYEQIRSCGMASLDEFKDAGDDVECLDALITEIAVKIAIGRVRPELLSDYDRKMLHAMARATFYLDIVGKIKSSDEK